MRQQTAVDGFRLVYERTGTLGRPAVLLYTAGRGTGPTTGRSHRAGAGSVAASLAEQVPAPAAPREFAAAVIAAVG
jgi:hypothetical protein